MKTVKAMKAMKTVQLSISARKLTSETKDPEEGLDTFAVVTVLSPNSRGTDPDILGKTEIIESSSNPDWKTNFYIDFEFQRERKTFILIKIFDSKIEYGNYREIVSGVFELGAILSEELKNMTKILKCGSSIEVQVDDNIQLGSLNLKMSGDSLKNVRGRRKKIIPFYQFTRLDYGLSGIEKKIVYSSKKLGQSSLNPIWQEEKIDVKTLCRGNIHNPILLSVYHHKSNGKHVLIGEVKTSVNDLISAQTSSNAMKVQKDGNLTGAINVLSASILGIE